MFLFLIKIYILFIDKEEAAVVVVAAVAFVDGKSKNFVYFVK
jgi:hypothetical protein